MSGDEASRTATNDGASVDPLLRDLAGAPPLELVAPVAIGDTLGRYRLARRLGGGSFGVVYEAEDLDLGRRVAVKVLRERWRGDDHFHERFHREAIACARLNHRNIVALYDYGTDEVAPYLVFELVDGTSVRDWLADRPRGRDEVLAVFRAAGAGLAAAHAAGLVHRDVKPENLLVGRDGVARVADFGLARPPAADAGAGAEAPATSGRAGTPRYMSPEQRAAAPVTARSDQYSFCLSLAEALLRRFPLDEEGAPRPLSGLPRRLRDALARGLRADPTARHPSMGALLAELAPRRRWRVAALAGALAAAAAAFALGRAGGGADLRCRGAERKLAGAWDGGLRRALEAKFLASRASAAPMAASFAAALDDYAAAWTAAHREACEATQLRHEQPEEVQGLRLGCLDDRLAALRALTGTVGAAGELDVEAALRAAFALPPIADCADVAALRTPQPLPADPALRRAIGAIRTQLAFARARMFLGQLASARAIAAGAVGASSLLPWPPLRAEALYTQANVEHEAGEAGRAEALWRAALGAALENRMDANASRSAAMLAYNLAARQSRFPEARAHAALALAEARRVGPGSDLEVGALEVAGVVAATEGRLDEAEGLLRQALAIATRLGVPGMLDPIHNNLAGTLLAQGRRAEAEAEWREALALAERYYGPDSLIGAEYLANLGVVRRGLGDAPGSLALLERAHRIRAAAYGPESAMTADSATYLADTLAKVGRVDEASTLYEEALVILAARVPDGPQLPAARTGLARILAERAETRPRARAEALAALARYRELFGPTHTRVILTLIMLAEIETDLEDFAAAEAHAEEAHRAAVTAYGADHPRAAQVLAAMAYTQHRAGRPRAAAELGLRAIAIWEPAAADWGPHLAELAAQVGQDLRALGRSAEADALAKRAAAWGPPP